MTWYSREDAAERAGVESPFLARLVDLGILVPHEPDRYSPGDVRRVLLANSLEQAGIPLEGVGAAIQRGALSLDFLDAVSYERFAALATESFRQVSDRTGIPLELLMVIREAIRMAQAWLPPGFRRRMSACTPGPSSFKRATTSARP